MLIRLGQHALAVSRKDNLTAMGLPGGKVEPADDVKALVLGLSSGEAVAAARELEEETGLRVHPRRLVRVFERVDDDDGYTCTTYEAEWSDCCGTINTTEAGRVRWVDWAELIDGPFGKYNVVLMQTLGLSASS